jgi:hypothetical protein
MHLPCLAVPTHRFLNIFPYQIKRPDREENFCFLKDARLSEYFTINTLLRSDEDLREAVRLCDTTQYLDTITLASSLLRGTTAARFFRTMMIASRGKFLETPCKLVYDGKAKKWSAEQPGWFITMGYYTFGTYLAQKIETILWMRYWRAFRIDPRKDISSSIAPALLASVLDDAAGGATRFQKQLLSKIHLVHYLKRLSPSDKKGIILNIGKAVKEVVRENLTSTNYPHWLSILLTFATPAPRMVSNLDLSSSTTPLSKVNNEGEFVELVFFSPLPRADTGMDLVLRRIGVFLQTSYTNKLSTDLILGEEMEKGSGKGSKKKHDSRSKGTSKPAQSSSSTTSPSTSSSSSSQATTTPAEVPAQPSPTKSVLKNSGGSSKSTNASQAAVPITAAPAALHPVPENSTAPTIAVPADGVPVSHKTSPPATKRTSASLTVSFSNQATPRNGPRFGLSHEAPEQREREEAFIHIQRRAESDTDEDSSGPWQTPGPRSSRLSGSYHGAQAHRRKSKDAEFPLPSRPSSRSTVARPLDLATPSRRIQVLKWPALSAAQSASFGRPKNPEPVSESGSATSPNHSASPSPRSVQEQHEKRGRTMSQPLATSAVAVSSEHAASAPTTPVPSPRGWATVSAPSIRTSQSQGASSNGSDERGRRPRRPSADAAPSSWRNAVAPVSPPQAVRGTSDVLPRAKSQELDLQPAPGMLPPTKSKSHGKLDSKHVRTKSNPNSSSSAIVSNTPAPAPSSSPTSVSPSASSSSVISSPSLAPGMVHHNWNTRRSNPQYGRYAYLAQQSTMLAARSRGGRHAQHVYPSGSISGTATPMRPDNRGDAGDGERRRSHSPPPRFRSPYDTAQYALPRDAEFYVLDKEHRYAPGGFLPFWPVYSPPIPIHAGGPSPASSPSMSPSNSSTSSASSFTAMINLGVAQTQAAHPFMAGLAFGVSPQSSVIPCGAAVRFELPLREELTTQRLHSDILNFCKQVDTLMEPKQAQLNQTFSLISALARELWPSCRVELYGSYATGLSIPSSDVDVVICGIDCADGSPLSYVHSHTLSYIVCSSSHSRFLHSILESALNTQAWVRSDSVHSIDSASVPVIKMVSRHGDLPVDITFEELAVRHSGTAARDKVNAFVQSFPHMRPLTVVLKQLLQNNNLNNAWIGGLSSYCLVLMIVSFVQAYHPTAANLGAALLDFLDVYGQVFVYDRMYIAVRTETSSLPNHSYGLALENLPESEGPLAPLSIIDPVRENNVLGKQTDSMFIVKMLFQNLFVGLDQHYSSPQFEPGKLHKLISDTKPTSGPSHSS